jgi:ATP-binding cassette subfamily B protein/subfamily B ATP-binding cassette protein MsbA
MAVFPPLLAAMYLFGKRMNQKSLAAHQADSAVSSLVQQNLTSLPVVQSYAREAAEQERFSAQVEASYEKRRQQHGVEVFYWLVIAVLFGMGTAGLAWWGGRAILKGQLTVGELVIFLSYLGQLYEPLNQLSHVGATVSDANAGIARIFEILDTQERAPEIQNARKMPDREGGLEIRFERVGFGYRPDEPVLKQITFDVRPGEVIGLVGPSGSGKTTLLNLIPRFYDAQTGAIRIGDIGLREFALEDLRRHIGYVFQEPFLLPGSIAENIAYGCPEAGMERIEEAAKMASAHQFIAKLPAGYETQVGEGAGRLSTGEKQRISIARAFLKNAPILLLDEPTSSLDAETEEEIIESMGKLMERRTCLIAAHRLASLRHVDRIITLENGVVTEIGTRDELLRGGKYFSRMNRSVSAE